MKISEIMSTSLKTITAEKTISDAQKMMQEHSIRHILVIDPVAGSLVGLISDKDIKKAVSPYVGTPQATERDMATLKTKIDQVMSKDLTTIKASEDVRVAVELMHAKKLESLPVIDDAKKAVGIVTIIDLLRTMKNLV